MASREYCHVKKVPRSRRVIWNLPSEYCLYHRYTTLTVCFLYGYWSQVGISLFDDQKSHLSRYTWCQMWEVCCGYSSSWSLSKYCTYSLSQNQSSQNISTGPETVKPVNVSTGPEPNYVVHELMSITIFTCIKLADLGYPGLYLVVGTDTYIMTPPKSPYLTKYTRIFLRLREILIYFDK